MGARAPRLLRRLALGAALIATGLLAAAGAAPAGADPAGADPGGRLKPPLVADDSVGADLSALAQDTWVQFLSVFSGQAGCIGVVYLHADHSLPSRGAYDAATSTVTVRVPASAALLKSALVHEWAHHVEQRCPSHPALRPAFLAAQGLPADAAWRPERPAGAASAGAWAEIPSEQYAEAAVRAVLGAGALPSSARLTPEAVDVVRRWAAGG